MSLEKKVEVKKEKPKFKRLFFDIETSPNIGFFWQAGYQINVPPENILQERAIICVCYKWEGEKEVHSLVWNKGNDKLLLQRFAKIIEEADEVVGHNSDKFDIKWLRTRCLYHNIPLMPVLKSVDTYKLATLGFRFNSNKLNYIAQFLGIGKKLETGGFDLWKSIVLHNSVESLNKMVEYCKNDVVLLEQVYEKIESYSKLKTHVGVHLGKDPCSCPQCGREDTTSKGFEVMASGRVRRRMICKRGCRRTFFVTEASYEKSRALKPRTNVAIAEKNRQEESTIRSK